MTQHMVPGPAMAADGRDQPEDQRFEAVYRAHCDRLRRVAYLMTGQAAVAEELAHDAFVQVHAHLDRIDNLAAYLHTTVVRLCLSWRGRDQMAQERVPRTPGWVEPAQFDETWQLLARLPRDQRVAVVLRFYEDLPVDRIAEVMGCRPSTVRTRIHRALTKLRKEMTP